MERWIIPGLAVLAMLMLVPGVSGLETWGCCIPPQDVCFDGNQGFTTEGDFIAACDAVGGTIQGEGSVTTCSGFPSCTVGCCCAGPEIVNSAQVNQDETLVTVTQIACDIKVGQGHDYSWEGPAPSGQTCVDVCGGGDPGTGNGETHTVSGLIKNGTGNIPLENVEVFIPIPAGAISDLTNEFGIYTLEEVPSMSSRVYAIHPACNPGVHPEIMIDEDKSDIDINLNCELGVCSPNDPEVIAVESITGTGTVAITADVDDNCQSFIQYEPLRCDENWEDCNPLQPSTSDIIEDNNVDPEETYCYIINARFGDGTVTSSGTTNSGACITTGVLECMNAQTQDSWCGVTEEGQAVLSCGEGNLIEIEDTCELEEICTMSGGASCIPKPECERCNGLLGLFGDAGLEIEIDGFLRLCGLETPLCFADISFGGRPMSFETYSSCAAVNTCADYVSGETCSNNPCGVNDACSWQEILPELGKGICLGEERPSCSACEDVMGFCNRDVCETISPECYFDEQPNGLAGELGPHYCIHRDDLGCRYYDSREDCEGGTAAVFDVSWAGDARSGSNRLTTSSNDAQGLGTCSWVASKNRCVKNSDMVMEEDEDDCYENRRYRDDPNCFEDNVPPETEWFLLDPPVYPIPAVRTWPFAVYDEGSPVGLIETYVCLASSGSCQPSTTLSALRLPEEGTYTLYYYSIDASENAEVVTSYPEQIVIQDYGEAVLREARLEPQ